MFKKKLIYPKEIILEVTNKCNLRCRFCHFHGENAVRKREIGSMDKRIWKKVLDEIRQWNKPCAILTHGAGEPLLYPDLKELLSAASGIDNLSTGFMTNGMLLTEDIAQKLIDLQVNSIALSIDGTNPETHDYFRRNADLKLIEKNVETLINLKEKNGSEFPRLFFNMVGYPEVLAQTEEYVTKWLPHADSVMISTFRPVGSRRLWDQSVNHKLEKCSLLYNQVVISIKGDMGLCCEDINLDVPLGNVMESDLISIFNNSENIKKYRKAHEKKKIGNLTLCSDCHVWGSHITLNKQKRNLNGLKVSEIVSPAGTLFKMDTYR